MTEAAELCSGRVRHLREAPFRHGFDYRVRMLLLDTERLEDVFRGRWLWGLDRFNVAGFHRTDHLDGGPDLAASARRRVESELGFLPEGKVWLLTQPRFLGFGFNPVSFYFLTAPGETRPGPLLDAILLEVSNTPWNERHVYAMDCRGRSAPWRFELDKAFHVSPFLPMDMRYRFRFDLDDDSINVTKENWQDGVRLFTAFMGLTREPLRATGMARALAGIPPTTLKVFGAIYWQALRLKLRGARYHSHPAGGQRTRG